MLRVAKSCLAWSTRWIMKVDTLYTLKEHVKNLFTMLGCKNVPPRIESYN